MSATWKPDDYQDEFRKRLETIIKKRIKARGATTKIVEEETEHEDAATNVVDFMSLLQKSLDSKKRTPAKKAAGKKAPARKAAKKASKATKKAPVKRARKAASR